MIEPTKTTLKYTSWTDDQLMDQLKHLAAQWFGNDDILLLEELFRRYNRVTPKRNP